MIAIVEAARAGLFGRSHWPANLLAGLVVGVVSLPLSMAFAIASGVTPQQGLITAVVAGLIVAVLGGTRVQIAGPTGAFVAILSGITASHGRDGLLLAGLMAGALLILLSLARMGRAIRHVPPAVILGFTSGIGLVILANQLPAFLGLPAPPAAPFHIRIGRLLQSLPAAHLATTLLAGFSLLLMQYGPRLPGCSRIPGPLLAMVAATLVQAQFGFAGVRTIGDTYGAIAASWPVPAVPDASPARLLGLLPAALSIALLGALESLLAARVTDPRHDGNQELLAQGLANIAAPLFGGLAASGALGRTATSVRLGATSPLAGITHAVVLLLILLLLGPLAARVPMCALAAILVGVSWHLMELPKLQTTLRTAPTIEVVALLVTYGLTLYANLVIAVGAGVAVALLGRRSRRLAGS